MTAQVDWPTMLYLAHHLLGLLGLAGLFYLTGWLVDRVLMGGRAMQPAAAAGWFGLGAATWMGWVFLLASVQLLSASALGLLALLTLVAVWRQRRSAAAGPLGTSPESSPTGRDPVAWLLGGFLAAVLVGLWLQALWPQVSWDADAYHLTIPRLYLEHGGFRRIPFNVYSNWPLNTQLLFALALTAKDYVLARSLHFAFGLATVLLVSRVVGRQSRPWAGGVAAALFLINPVVLDEFRAVYVDLAFAFFFLLAFVFMHHALETSVERGRWLMVAGLFGGVAAGIKPNGVVAVACLCLVYLVAARRQGHKAAEAVVGLARIVVPAALLLTPWVVKSWVLTGNPVYPFLYPLLGGPEWSAELGAQLRTWQQGMGMGRSALDYLLLPVRVVIAGDSGYAHFDGRISPVWLVVVPLALTLSRRQTLIARSLAVAGLYFVFWALSSQQMRFLIPILPFLAIAGGLALIETVRWVQGRTQPLVKWAVSLGAMIAMGMAASGMVAPTWNMTGQYLELGEGVRQGAVHPVFRFIDEQLPEEAKLMFLNTNHGFFCRREFVADSFFEASQINDLLRSREGKEGVQAALQELGITHFLIENRDRNVPWPKSLYDFLNDPARARSIYRSPDSVYDVFEVQGRSAPGS